MDLFEDQSITAQIERNPKAYFKLFNEDVKFDPLLSVALDALKACAHE